MHGSVALGGIGLLLLIWAFFRGGGFTMVLTIIGVVLIGGGLLTQVTHASVGALTSVLNSLGGAL